MSCIFCVPNISILHRALSYIPIPQRKANVVFQRTGIFFFFEINIHVLYINVGVFLRPQCSRTCARGYQYRIVECVGGRECDKRTKPPVWRPCNMGKCGGFLFWRVGPWSQVMQYRAVTFVCKNKKLLLWSNTADENKAMNQPEIEEREQVMIRFCLVCLRMRKLLCQPESKSAVKQNQSKREITFYILLLNKLTTKENGASEKLTMDHSPFCNEDFRSGFRNVSQCDQQQFPCLLSHR